MDILIHNSTKHIQSVQVYSKQLFNLNQIDLGFVYAHWFGFRVLQSNLSVPDPNKIFFISDWMKLFIVMIMEQKGCDSLCGIIGMGSSIFMRVKGGDVVSRKRNVRDNELLHYGYFIIMMISSIILSD